MYRSGPPSVKAALFSQKNRETLQQLLIQDFQKRQNQALNGKQLDRLERALDHYVEQVYGTQGEQPLPVLNREVLKITAQDFSKYLQRQNVVQVAQTVDQSPVQTVMNQSLYMDTARRFDQLQTDRQEVKALPPPPPDFRVSLDDEEAPSSASLYEMAKKQRESEAQRLLNSGKDAMERIDPGLNKRIQADDFFRSGQLSQNKATDMALASRQTSIQPLDMPLIIPPDGRELAMAALSPLMLTENPGPRGLGDANGNPTTTIPSFLSPQKTNLPQDYIIRQENTVAYKEIENNLFVYSADRDWMKNVKENRYNFSVTFDPGNNGQGYYPQVRVQEKFKNITRIEFVKAILPVEGLDVLIEPTVSAATNITAYQNTVLSLPFVSVNIPELENNNFGSDNFIDRAFSVIQYDQNWYSNLSSTILDTTSKQTNDSRGFTSLVPRYLKCQKVYAPTPLSTLQRLSISLLRPNGQSVSLAADTFDISGVFAGSNTDFAASLYKNNDLNNPYYIFINTTTYFSRFQVNIGDNIQIGNFDFSDNLTRTSQDFTSWINQPSGFLVAAIGNSSSGTYADGPNSVGYANYIILQAKHLDPTSGSVGLNPYGGVDGDITNYIGNTPVALANPPRRLINLSRQTQLVFRVITREMDPVAGLRPDNM
uniref:Uncharacterized protein n=1 Tax=viral metagenome TaxID=1070528 RepID=A0A6C0DHT5_9ZZZZ